jgi:DNA-directed RNA polymerase specialized sigma24 family protein
MFVTFGGERCYLCGHIGIMLREAISGRVCVMDDVSTILNSDLSESGKSADELFPLVYNELRRLAGARMAGEVRQHTLQATALVHEAWLRMVRDEDRSWENRASFFSAASLAMRRILIQLEQLHPEWAKIVVMKYFGGMTQQEIAEALGIGERSVRRYWTFARAWLYDRIRSETE